MQKFIEKLQEALMMEDKEINSADNFRDYEEWDSLAVLAVMAMINDEYDVTIPRKELENVDTVENFWELIKSKK